MNGYMEVSFSLLGGLGFFMYGMHLMSDGLKKVASHQLRRVLAALTKNRVAGLLMGALVTAIVQSSSFTTVMTVGLVNASLLTLKQGICVVLGANIGTTATAWIVSTAGAMKALKITTYALPAVGLGFLMNFIPKKQSLKNWGAVILGLGMLFVGIGFMKEAFPVKAHDASSWAHQFFENFSRYPLLGIVAGTVLTMLLQSSSATIMIVQVLAMQGYIGFPAALPLILGDNIGTTITAELAATQASGNGKRVARAHTLFNVIGVCLVLPFIFIGEPSLWLRLVDFCLPDSLVHALVPAKLADRAFPFAERGAQIAMAHFLFNTFNAVVFLPFLWLLERATGYLVRSRGELFEVGTTSLERHLLATPTVALDQARKETVRMLTVTRLAVADATAGFFGADSRRLHDAQTKEDVVDRLQTEITQYLIEISERGLGTEEAEQLPVFMHTVNDVERVSDHAVNIIELAARKTAEKVEFSQQAQDELRELAERVEQMIQEVTEALKNRDTQAAERVLEIEDWINNRQSQLKQNHIDRLNRGVCSLQTGLHFLDFVDNIEEMGDKLTNIAQAVIAGMRWETGAPSSSPSAETV